MKILAIGAHPDDIEIFMFGLLTRFKERGDDIFTIVATDGAKGGETKGQSLIKIRIEEARRGLDSLCLPVFLNIPDGELGEMNSHKTLIKERIFEIMPDLIVTHSPNDYHSDHRSLSLLTRNVASHYIPILYCDTLMGINFQPNYYVDISNSFDKKINAILEHKSQKPQRFVDLSHLMNSFRAAQCNSPKGTFAEAYNFQPSFPFTDIRNLLPSQPKLRPFYIENKFGFL
tara:strand:+ start:2349 stop:3038 length:690 start_codon:yes stop_codon:yes gene_type:complete